ncbi:methionyl-tRNA formyltransferase-like protein [Halorarum halophilum]|uniref:Methionyl-tRNA formyltransferase-like protein n=1 Tax=Halorarum halophilum TaxID=2743090 RepID=A0A7D5GB64_9EURY|nr:formyltransferase family protein [Halobaculum halophilum]QLG27226.1 methionyl-tRNA formyltransferase-like protein [Halobaculum halophilum]
MRVCLLLDEPTVSRYVADTLATLFAEPDVELTTVVYNEYEESRTPQETIERAIELREWTPVSLLTKLLGRPVPETDPVRLDFVVDLDSARTFHVRPSIVDGWKQRIPEETVESVAPHADVGIRFGFGFLVGPILSELDHGVLSFHHGDLREYRGMPMGFWEFVHGDDTAGITVQQLSETLDGGRIAALKTVPIDDLHTWGAVRRRLFVESDDMLATAVENIREGAVREPESLGDLYTLPRGAPVAKFVLKNATGYLRESI